MIRGIMKTKEFTKSVLAGILIGLCGFIFLQCENKVIGAFLFSLGLLTILTFELNLFTGKIYSLSSKNIMDMIVYLIGNSIGAYIITGIPIALLTDINTNILWETKL